MRLPQPDADGRIQVNGVLPGTYRVTVQRGGPYDRGVLYGESTVTVSESSETSCDIVCEPGAPPERVRVTGAVLVSNLWPERPSRLTMHGAEGANAECQVSTNLQPAELGRPIRFEFDGVPIGRYLLEVQPLDWRSTVVVGPGATRLELDLGNPAELTVNVFEYGLRVPLVDASVAWSIEGNPMRERGVVRRGGGCIVCVVPPGMIHFVTRASGFAPKVSAVRLDPGECASVDVELRRSSRLIVRLEKDGVAYVDGHPMIFIQPASELNDPSAGRSTEATDGTARFREIPVGTYWLSVGRLPHGLAAEATQVQVQVGEETTASVRILQSKE
jgi:hypothetical protein